LIWYFVQRQLSSSYRGSFLGFAWLILGPLLMVALYTLVFSGIIGLRFRQTDSVSNFGLYVYCGLLPFLAFSDTLTQSVKSIRSNAALVQRVVFPLEILPITTATTAYITQFFGVGVLIILVALLEHGLHWTLLLLPIVAVPQLIFLLGLSYLASVAGAYLPDLREAVQALVRALLFALPIFWPADMVPDRFRFIVDYNPLAFQVVAYRNLVLEGRLPDVTLLLWFTLFATALMVAGLALFLRAKKRFADLI
jgi:ABC-2 type transport system permease protein